uniref:Uncharacterized protein n=1 Tax=Physcomitrium patens TaxID=3218 RepID=A0A7I4AYQ3_PHYPA
MYVSHCEICGVCINTLSKPSCLTRKNHALHHTLIADPPSPLFSGSIIRTRKSRSIIEARGFGIHSHTNRVKPFKIIGPDDSFDIQIQCKQTPKGFAKLTHRSPATVTVHMKWWCGLGEDCRLTSPKQVWDLVKIATDYHTYIPNATIVGQ